LHSVSYKPATTAIFVCFLKQSSKRFASHTTTTYATAKTSSQIRFKLTAADTQSASSSWCPAPFGDHDQILIFFLNHWVMHPVARVSTNIYIETSVSNKSQCSFYCAPLTLHVSAPIGGHLQVVCNTKNSKA
jgi:hypothetical protein